MSRLHRTFVALGIASFASIVASDARAQSCDTSCPIRMRDARGCCPAGATPTPAPATPAQPEKPAPAKPSKPSKACPPGQEVTPDTANHCCWPGQAWSGSACVGVPTVCPAGFKVVRDKQICELEECGGGRVRSSDNVHCCWPGQAWTASRDACVGLPQCPANTEPEGETCVSTDLDGDGIPNKADRCPKDPEDRDGFQDEDGCPDPDNDADGILDAKDQCPMQAEDKNGHKDDDGCPDEPERASIVAAQQRVAAAQAEEEKKKKEDEARKKREMEEAALRQEEEDARTGRRTTGIWLTGAGVVTLAGSGLFMLLGEGTNSAIKDGGFATADEIESKNSTGKTFNVLAIVTGAIGGGLVAVGLPLWLANGSKSAPKTGATSNGFIVRF